MTGNNFFKMVPISMKNIAQAFQLAVKNIRSRLFHTFLSVLGIIIGVGALVSILSLIDGLEQFAKEQIDESTGINTVIVSAPDTEVINDVTIQKENVKKFDYQIISAMMEEVDEVPRYIFNTAWSDMILFQEEEVATAIDAVAYYETNEDKINQVEESMLEGNPITLSNNIKEESVAVINESLFELISTDEQSVIGQKLQIGEEILTIQGVRKDDDSEPPKLQMPASLLTLEEMQTKAPIFFVQASDIEDLRGLQEQMEQYIGNNHPELKEDIKVEINEFRMEQLEQGFLLFRVIMGLIVGISVVVGGVGIMNVMLISLKERTPEIGIRKAIGAKRKDILSQFLSESVFISLLGSLLGIIFGILFTAIAIPIVNTIIENTGGEGEGLRAAYTINTLLTISVIAVLIGIIFGTYPAVRASKLKPVDAIRRV